MQLSTVIVLLLHMHWPLGLLVLGTAVPIIVLSVRFERRYRKVSRQVQDEQGDLATLVEESALGIRTIKAFGRRPPRLRGLRRGRPPVHGTLMHKVRLSARFFTFVGGDPERHARPGAAARRARRGRAAG